VTTAAVRPLVVTDRVALSAARAALPGRVAVVMTMGGLHDGHVELVRRARASADAVLVTVFVNPLQFGAGEDLERYPRTLAADVERCGEAGADVVLAPPPYVVYPAGEPVVRVSAGVLGEIFEGASRPGHLDGMLTVVAKLLHLTQPDLALFGQKDAQQLAAVRRMVRDLDMGVEVVAVPTVRERDGLAMSSRNGYLSPPERAAANALYRALRTVADTGSLPAGRAVLDAEPLVRTDYLARVDPDSFTADPRGGLAVVAAHVGATRLIDNLVLDPAVEGP